MESKQMRELFYVSTSLRASPHVGRSANGGPPTIAAKGADTSGDGLYRATLQDGEVEIEHLGLNGLGGLRAPVIVDAANPQTLYAATNRGGIFRSDDEGRSWREMNQGLTYKEVWSLVQHPQTLDLYAGTGPGTVFKSTDGAETWIECEALQALASRKDWTFPGPPYVAHVKWLSLHPEDPKRIWGAVEEGWLIRSLDGGETWDNVKNGSCFDSHSTLMLQNDPDVVISTSGKGVFRSEDNGESFEECNTGIDRLYLAQVVGHPSRPDVLFTAGAESSPPSWAKRPTGANSAFYRSEDQGRTWGQLAGGLPEVITGAARAAAGDAHNPDAFFVGLNDGSIWGTHDAGESFRQLVTGLPPVSAMSVSSA
jgi:photosystem II stability/assembly factor-like uncharacterized protein